MLSSKQTTRVCTSRRDVTPFEGFSVQLSMIVIGKLLETLFKLFGATTGENATRAFDALWECEKRLDRCAARCSAPTVPIQHEIQKVKMEARQLEQAKTSHTLTTEISNTTSF